MSSRILLGGQVYDRYNQEAYRLLKLNAKFKQQFRDFLNNVRATEGANAITDDPELVFQRFLFGNRRNTLSEKEKSSILKEYLLSSYNIELPDVPEEDEASSKAPATFPILATSSTRNVPVPSAPPLFPRAVMEEPEFQILLPEEPAVPRVVQAVPIDLPASELPMREPPRPTAPMAAMTPMAPMAAVSRVVPTTFMQPFATPVTRRKKRSSSISKPKCPRGSQRGADDKCHKNKKASPKKRSGAKRSSKKSTKKASKKSSKKSTKKTSKKRCPNGSRRVKGICRKY